MAATMSAWAKPGAGSWALDSEENEAELQLQDQQPQKDDVGPADFPSLSAAVATKSKKKKGQTLSLAEFSTYSGPAKPASQATYKAKGGGGGLGYDELLALPTGPRERTAEELDRSRGFRSYGLGGDRNRDGDDSSNSRWGSNSRVSGDRREGGFGRDSSRGELAPSRADEIDNWAVGKKAPAGNGFERRERGGGGGGFFDSQSKADESDSWVSNKSFVPTEGRRFGGGGGGGFDRERRGGGGFESYTNTNGGGADSDLWGKKKEEGSGIVNVNGRPRLNLQPRTKPVSDGPQQVPEVVAKPKGSNPFGEARPREEVLAEKGQDWKKIDEQLDSMKIKEMSSAGASATDGPPFGKRGFGNGRSSLPDDRDDRSWRKTEDVDVRPASAEKPENAEAEVEAKAEAEDEEN